MAYSGDGSEFGSNYGDVRNPFSDSTHGSGIADHASATPTQSSSMPGSGSGMGSWEPGKTVGSGSGMGQWDGTREVVKNSEPQKRTIDFESTENPGYRSNGAYGNGEPDWFKNRGRASPTETELAQEKAKSKASANSGEGLEDSLLGGPGGRSAGVSARCCQGRSMRLYALRFFLILATLSSGVLFSFSLVQQLNVTLNIGSGCEGKCLDLSTQALKKKYKCTFQYEEVPHKGGQPRSCGSTKYAPIDDASVYKWSQPVRFRCSDFPEGQYVATPWPKLNAQWRAGGGLAGLILGVCYFFIIKRCDCCVSFMLTVINIVMVVQGFWSFVCCIMDAVAIGQANADCDAGFKVHKYDYSKKSVSIVPICDSVVAKSTNTGSPCENAEFMWMVLGGAINGLLWFITAYLLKLWKKHREDAPKLSLNDDRI